MENSRKTTIPLSKIEENITKWFDKFMVAEGTQRGELADAIIVLEHLYYSRTGHYYNIKHLPVKRGCRR
jgi:hypothetical protein